MTLTQRIQRMNAVIECEKVMSRHVYYHAAGIHREELEEFWSKRPECTWAHNFGQMGNRENYHLCYVGDQERDTAKLYEELQTIYPEVADKDRVPDYRALLEEAIHFFTTSVIEVAQDGQSARGLFYTPGCIVSTLNPEKAREGTWIYERYGADFVLEDGKWVYLNLKVCCDLAGSLDQLDWSVSPRPMPPMEDGEDGPPDNPGGEHPIMWPGPLHWDSTPTQCVQRRPFIPVRYETYDSNASYAVLTGIYEKK